VRQTIACHFQSHLAPLRGLPMRRYFCLLTA
jgi:hypothetical protein